MEISKIKKNIFFNINKMFKISAKTFSENCIHNIIDTEKMLWLRNKDIGEKLVVNNIYHIIDKEIKAIFETKNSKDEQIRK